MRGTKWLRLTWLAALTAGCGEGHAIFNVDVYSFIKGTAQDTIPYLIPIGTDSASSVPQRIGLPGAGASIVDSVLARGTLDFHNDSGSGTIGLEMYLAGDSVGTYSGGALALTVPAVPVSGTNTVTSDSILGKLIAGDSLFADTVLWVRFQSKGSNPGPGLLLQGKAVITSLFLTVVITDKIF